MTPASKKVDVQNILANPVAREEKPAVPKENVWGWLSYISGQMFIAGACLLITIYIGDLKNLKSINEDTLIGIAKILIMIGFVLFPISVYMDMKRQQNQSKVPKWIRLITFIFLGLMCSIFIFSIMDNLCSDILFWVTNVLYNLTSLHFLQLLRLS